MSRSLNVATVAGYLGQDPKLHTFDDGNTTATLSVCVNNSKKVNGEWTDVPLWVEVRTYGKRCEAIGQYLTKGSFVLASGRLVTRTWAGDDGNEHTVVVIDSADVTFGPRGNGSEQAEPRSAKATSAADEFGDEDIPF